MQPTTATGLIGEPVAARQASHHASQPIAEAKDLATFSSLVSSSFVPLEVSTEQSAQTGPFSARISSVDAGDVAFSEVIASPHLVERTAETIESGGSGYYKVSLMLAGTSILVQDGKELVMRAGDLSIYDTSRPYSLLQTEQFRLLIMMFPKNRLELPAPFTQQLTAESLGDQNPGLTSVLSAVLTQFPEHLSPLRPRVRAKLAHTSLDLLGTLLASILDTDPASRDPHQLLLQKIYAYIEGNLGSPTLTPNAIAAAHHVSTRHLHSLFLETGVTVSTWVRERRLERCRAELLDPLHSERAVAAIAARWGFRDAAHFSRAFKATYGVSPSELRQ